MDSGSCSVPETGSTDTCSGSPGGNDIFSFGLSPKVITFVVAPVLALLPAFFIFAVPAIFGWFGSILGSFLRGKTNGRRTQILEVIAADELKDGKKNVENKSDKDDDWSGVVGFFHPFCNAGGGGERVLWAAIRATQLRWPKARIVVYTGDHEVNKEQILALAENRFNIRLYAPTIQFLYLTSRHWVQPSTWPRFTLLGQALGSLFLAWDAFSLIVPDIFVDTMGFAFALGMARWLFPDIPSGAYVHYPTISTDMIQSLDPDSPLGSLGVNAGQGAGFRGAIKRSYWKFFAYLYAKMGATIDVVMTNSSWTQAHVSSLWGPSRRDAQKNEPISVVYPPCAVEELENAIEVSEASESKREKVLLYIAQFRPEKNHQMIVEAFADFVKSGSAAAQGAKLELVGSVRAGGEDSKLVYTLRVLCRELQIADRVTFSIDAPWELVLERLQKSTVGVNGMWNEHFGIGVVEYLASGLIPVAHDSGGPKMDIVVPVDGEPTGFHASTVKGFSEAFEKALSIPDPLVYRLRGRESAKRFGEIEFDRKWLEQMTKLVALHKTKQ